MTQATDDLDVIAEKVNLPVRCSRLPLALKCAASQETDGIVHDTAGEAADIGTAVHAWLAARIRGIDLDSLDVARRHAVDPNETAMLCRWAWRAWQSISDHFPEARPEVPLAFGRLTGTIDLLSPPLSCGGEVRLLDWKSGRVESEPRYQLMGYAWLAVQKYPEATGAYVAEIRVRDQVIDGERWSREDLEDWYDILEGKLANTDRFNPGLHCGTCPRGITCPAKSGLLAQAAEMLLGQKMHASNMPTADLDKGNFLSALVEQCRMVERATEQIREAAKAEVALAGGRLPMSDGREIAIKREVRKPILFNEAYPVLDELVTESQRNSVFKVGKTALESVVKERAGKGQKDAAYRMILDQLASRGAIGEEIVEKLEIRKPKALESK